MAKNIFLLIKTPMLDMNAREYKIPQVKNLEFHFTLLFGLSYLLDLYNYIGYKASFFVNESDFKKQIVKAELYSMCLLLALFLYIFVFKKQNIKPISLRIFFWYGLAIQLFLTFLTPIVHTIDAESFLFYPIRFIEATICCINFCTYLSIVGRDVSRKKRTWTVVLIFTLGFLGPFCTSIIHYYQCNWAYYIIPVIILGYALYIYTYKDEKNAIIGKNLFETTNDNDTIELSESIKHILVRANFWRALLMLFLCGLMVQYSVRFLLDHSDAFASNYFSIVGAKNFRDIVYMLRYLGSSFGVVLLGYFSILFSKTYLRIGIFQVRIGERKVAYQLAALCGMASLYGFSQLDTHYENVYWRYGTPFLLGISNAIWCIIFLQALEAFGRKTQPIFVFLLPIFLRGFWEYLDYPTLKNILFGKFDDNLPIIQSFNNTVLLIGFILLIIGFVTSLLWQDNFEGGNRLDDYDDNFSKGFATAIVNDELRKEIVSIDERIVSAEKMDTYIEEVSRLVKQRLETVFDTSLYYYSFTFLNEEREASASKVKVNDNALKDLKKAKKASIRKLFKYIRMILKEKEDSGLASYSFENKKEGLVLVGNSKTLMPQLQKSYETAGYQIFDLSKIPLPKESMIKDFWQSLSEMSDEDFEDKDKVETNIKSKFRVINDELRKLHEANTAKMLETKDKGKPKSAADATIFAEANFPQRIRRLLTLRALGAWCYPKHEYFIYVITPQAGTGVKHNLNTSILLATANLIPVEKLNEIRQLLDIVMFQRALVMSKDAEAKNMIIQLSHSLKTSLGHLQNQISSFGEVRNDAAKFEARKTAASRVIATIADTIVFNSKLTRYKSNPEKINDNRFNIPSNGINVHDTIIGILQELRMSVGLLLNTNTDEQQEQFEQLLEETIRKGVDMDKNIRLKVIPIGFRILMTEILKNAYAYASSNKPQVQINWEERTEHIILSVTNNGIIQDKDINYINNYDNQNEVNKIGITTMRTIINFKYFNQTQIDSDGKQRWKINVEKITPERGVKFNLIILKSDTYV